MNKKSILSFIIIVALLAAATTVYAVVTEMFSTPDNKTLDITYAQEGEVLLPKIDAGLSPGTAKLNIPWGKGDECFEYYISDEDGSSCEAPSAYTVDSEGIVYVFDSISQKVKAFKDNTLIKDYDLTELSNSGNYITISSIGVAKDGTIYVLESTENKVYTLSDSEFKACDIFGDLGYVEYMDILPSDNIMIRDNYWQDGSIRIRKFTPKGKKITNSTMGFYVSDAAYEFEDAKGNKIQIVENGFRTYQIHLLDSNGNILSTVNFSTYFEGFNNSTNFIGCDAEGNLYTYMQEDVTAEDGSSTFGRDYLCKINISDGSIQTIQIPVHDGTMNNSWIIYGRQNICVGTNGTVYRAYMNQKDGFSIVLFNF